MPDSRIEYTSDGWAITWREMFEYLVNHEPPRPSRFWRQMAIDARSLLPWLFWIAGLSLVAVGFHYTMPGIAFFGVMIFVLYVRLVRRQWQSWRNEIVQRGIIHEPALKPHPIYANHGIAEARLPSGEIIRVAVYRQLVEPILAAGQPAEVLFHQLVRIVETAN